MATFAWRAFPIGALTVRQFVGGKAVRVVAGLTLIPVVFALIYAVTPDKPSAIEFVVGDIFRAMYVATLLPVTILILATGAFGNEIEDRTLPYLTLKPISRFRIVVEKLLGTVLVCLPIIMAGLAITFFVAFRGEAGDNLNVLWAMWGGAAAGVVGYTAIFQLISLLIARALLAGIVYSLLWESLLGRYIPGIRYISIRHYTTSVFVQILDNRRYTLDNAFGLTAAVVTILVATLICIALATWRLRAMNLE
jgi:ABC-2 type transport system permease protein